MRVLMLSHMYPSPVNPTGGIFVHERHGTLVCLPCSRPAENLGECQCRVVLPWPLSGCAVGVAGMLCAVGIATGVVQVAISRA